MAILMDNSTFRNSTNVLQSIVISEVEHGISIAFRVVAAVLLAFYLFFDWKIFRNFRRLNNHFYAFVLSFAVAGFLMLIALASDLTFSMSRICLLDFFGCLIPALAIQTTCDYACVYTSFLLAVNRYLMVANNHLYQKIWSWQSISISLVVLWLFAGLETASMHLAMNFHEVANATHSDAHTLKGIDDAWIISCDIALPCALILASFVLYVLIYVHVLRQKERLARHSLTSNNRSRFSDPNNETNDISNNPFEPQSNAVEVTDEAGPSRDIDLSTEKDGLKATTVHRSTKSFFRRNGQGILRQREISILLQAFLTSLMVCFYRAVVLTWRFYFQDIYLNETLRTVMNSLGFLARLSYYGLQPFVLLAFSSELRGLFIKR